MKWYSISFTIRATQINVTMTCDHIQQQQWKSMIRKEASLARFESSQVCAIKHKCLEGNLTTWLSRKITKAEGRVLRNANLWTWHGYDTHKPPAAIGICVRPMQNQANENPAELGDVLSGPCLLRRSYWKFRGDGRRRIILIFIYWFLRMWQLVANRPRAILPWAALLGLRRLFKT